MSSCLAWNFSIMLTNTKSSQFEIWLEQLSFCQFGFMPQSGCISSVYFDLLGWLSQSCMRHNLLIIEITIHLCIWSWFFGLKTLWIFGTNLSVTFCGDITHWSFSFVDIVYKWRRMLFVMDNKHRTLHLPADQTRTGLFHKMVLNVQYIVIIWNLPSDV